MSGNDKRIIAVETGWTAVTREQAIVEFARLVVEHIRIDGCERNRANGTEIIKALAKCLIDERPPRQNQIEGLL